MQFTSRHEPHTTEWASSASLFDPAFLEGNARVSVLALCMTWPSLILFIVRTVVYISLSFHLLGWVVFCDPLFKFLGQRLVVTVKLGNSGDRFPCDFLNLVPQLWCKGGSSRHIGDDEEDSLSSGHVPFDGQFLIYTISEVNAEFLKDFSDSAL